MRLNKELRRSQSPPSKTSRPATSPSSTSASSPSLYDTLIIATAESNRQVKALASHVRDKLEAAGATIIGVEGEETAEWVLVDAGDIVVHIMQPAVRAHYNLEELWAPAQGVARAAPPRTARRRRPIPCDRRA